MLLIKEPCVIDDKLILEAQKLSEENGGGVNEEGKTSFHNLRKLCLSYKNIIKIQNLMGLDNLEVLRLDNNLIEKIENLDHLSNLRWLDLSFNNITSVDNLGMLGNLTDLILYNNRIESVSFNALKGLRKLNILSISNNRIGDLMELLKALKPIKTLEVLTVKGNPCTSDSEFKNYVVANLTQLKYLDYVFIDEHMRNTPDEFKYGSELGGEKEARDNPRKEEAGEDNDEVNRTLKELNLINYDKYLLSGNEDLTTFLNIKHVFEDCTLKLNENIKNLIETIRGRMAEVVSQKKKVKNQFETAYRRMVVENEGESQNLIDKYFHSKKRLLLFIEETSFGNKREKTGQILDQLTKLDECLIEREMGLKAQLNSSYTSMERNFNRIFETLVNILVDGNGIKLVEEFLGEFFAKFTDDAIAEADKCESYAANQSSRFSLSHEELGGFASDKEDGEGSPWTFSQQALLENKDELRNSVNAIKEFVENKHRDNATRIASELNSEKNSYLQEIQKNIKELNRKNINNIVDFIKEETDYWQDRFEQLR
jgi:hypothetical protein